MTPTITEILNKFQQQTTKEGRIQVLREHRKYQHFLKFLENVFNQDIQYYPVTFPSNYKKPDTFPGISYGSLTSELHKSYLFQKGNPIAEALTPEKRIQVLTQLIETFEPSEATLFVQMLQKKLTIPYLTYNLIKEAYEG